MSNHDKNFCHVVDLEEGLSMVAIGIWDEEAFGYRVTCEMVGTVSRSYAAPPKIDLTHLKKPQPVDACLRCGGLDVDCDCVRGVF